jgi:TetR/AcrR family transcriptional regulator, transcriptional repressor for nem operon
MARYSKEHRAKTREALVEAASKLLREKGFEGTGVADVMSAVGLTHGGFYAHFPDKTALLGAALEKALEQSPINFALLVKAAVAQDDLGLMAERYLSDSKISDVATGCATAALASEMHRQPASITASFLEGSEATAEVVGQVPELGDFKWAVLAMLVGAKSMMRGLPQGERHEVIRREVANALRTLSKSGQ